MSLVTKVYRFGCRRPNDERLALQLLGQAWHYAEDIRRVYNAQKRDIRELRQSDDDTAHVFQYLFKTATPRQLCQARSGRGHLVDWGTYNVVVESATLQASKDSGLDPIKPRPFDGTGLLAAAIRSGQYFPASAWNHSRVQLHIDEGPHRSKRAQRSSFGTLTILVGEAKAGQSITWPIKLHRPFPKGAIVKQVKMQRTRFGHRFRWEALVTLTYEEVHKDTNAEGTVGVDLGWRYEEPKKTRVATTTPNTKDALFIDTHEAFEYADSVRSIRDKNFDDVKEYAKQQGLHPHVKQWRDKSRMHNLASADFGVAWWAYRDRHLEDIECGVRTRAQRRRTHVFRVFADSLAKQFARVALEDMPMSDFVGEAETHRKERRRSTAALSELQTAIVNRFGPGRVDWVPAKNTTRECSACPTGMRPEHLSSEEFWTCPDCGTLHQRDENSSCNIRERALAGTNVRSTRTRKSKKGKGKGKGEALATPIGTSLVIAAREPLDNAAE